MENLEKEVSKPVKNEDASDHWTHVIIEAYCTRTIFDTKSKYIYALEDLKTGKHKKIPNPYYDPKYKTPRKPRFCPNLPQYICLKKDCPHFGHTDADKKDYMLFSKLYKNKKK